MQWARIWMLLCLGSLAIVAVAGISVRLVVGIPCGQDLPGYPDVIGLPVGMAKFILNGTPKGADADAANTLRVHRKNRKGDFFNVALHLDAAGRRVERTSCIFFGASQGP